MNRRTKVSMQMLYERQQDILGLFCKAKPPIELIIAWNSDSEIEPLESLQDWVCDNQKKEFSYATGIDMIDAAIIIARSQIDNGGEQLESEGE